MKWNPEKSIKSNPKAGSSAMQFDVVHPLLSLLPPGSSHPRWKHGRAVPGCPLSHPHLLPGDPADAQHLIPYRDRQPPRRQLATWIICVMRPIGIKETGAFELFPPRYDHLFCLPQINDFPLIGASEVGRTMGEVRHCIVLNARWVILLGQRTPVLPWRLTKLSCWVPQGSSPSRVDTPDWSPTTVCNLATSFKL